jgi:hypothetical protein
LGIQPLNHLEHATQIIAEATALLELNSTKRAKLPAQSLEAFLKSVITLAKKTREQPSAQEILGKLNSLQPIAEDITLIKNAVNNVLASPAPIPPNAATRIASWADVVRSGTPSYPSTPNSRASTTASVKDRETVVKLDANSAAVLRKISPEDIRKRVNDALGSRINLLGKAPRVIAAKQLKSGDVVLHTATTSEADTLKSTEEEWVKVLGTTARVIKPSYGVIVHGVRTDKESIDTDNQERAIEKIESENAVLHEGAKVTYVGWLTKEGRKKAASSLVVEFTTKYHANRVIREGLVLNAIHHDCVLYDRSCRLKQCYRCHEYGHIGPQCDAEERCGYCAGAHNTKECIARDADPKPAPKCVLCKGQHTAWSNACPRRRREQARIEQARKTRPIFHYESDESRPAAAGTTTGGAVERPLNPLESGSGLVNLTDTPTPSLPASQPHQYDLRRTIQPTTRAGEDEWQTARPRRRTRSPQKSSQRDRSRSPRAGQGRSALSERPVNATLRRGNVQDQAVPGEKIQTLENFFQLTPSQQ